MAQTDKLAWIIGLANALEANGKPEAAAKIKEILGTESVKGIAAIIGEYNSGDNLLQTEPLMLPLNLKLSKPLSTKLNFAGVEIPFTVEAGQDIGVDVSLNMGDIGVGILLGVLLSMYLAD